MRPAEIFFVGVLILAGVLAGLRIALGPVSLMAANIYLDVINKTPHPITIVSVTFDGEPVDLKGQSKLAPLAANDPRESVAALDAGHDLFGGPVEVQYRIGSGGSDSVHTAAGYARVGGMELPSCSIEILEDDRAVTDCMDETD